ncbi:hypothetical protein EJB05_37976, partial [Eragrostis curvula]
PDGHFLSRERNRSPSPSPASPASLDSQPIHRLLPVYRCFFALLLGPPPPPPSCSDDAPRRLPASAQIAAPPFAAPAPNEVQCRRLRFASLLAASPTTCSGLAVPLVVQQCIFLSQSVRGESHIGQRATAEGILKYSDCLTDHLLSIKNFKSQGCPVEHNSLKSTDCVQNSEPSGKVIKRILTKVLTGTSPLTGEPSSCT